MNAPLPYPQTILQQPAFPVYSRVIYRVMQSKDIDADAAFRRAGLDPSVLWGEQRGRSGEWTYEMWFSAMHLGYRELGSEFSLEISKAFGFALYPLMETIIATAPNLLTIFDFFEGWQQELEPLLTLTQFRKRNESLVCLKYPLRGKILEAFAFAAGAMAIDLARTTAGYLVDLRVSVNFPDTHKNFSKWSEDTDVPMEYDPKQKNSLVLIIPNEVMTQESIGHDPFRFTAAREQYVETIEQLQQGFYQADLVDYAATIMMTAQKQYTRESLCAELNVSQKAYSSAIASKGMTHQTFVDACNHRRLNEMVSMGYTDARCCANLGFNDSRKLKRLRDRVSP